MIKIEIGNKEYKVKQAKTDEEKEKGLSGVAELPENEGMLFYYDKPQKVSFWMKDTLIPLDIIFINGDEEVINVQEGQPNDDTPIVEWDVQYVLEVNAGSGISQGDILEFDDDDDSDDSESSSKKMLVLSSTGDTQMELEGGERIFSRRSTRILIKKAKKAKSVQHDEEKFKKACKSLGKYLFKELKAQDTRGVEYVDNPNASNN